MTIARNGWFLSLTKIRRCPHQTGKGGSFPSTLCATFPALAKQTDLPHRPGGHCCSSRWLVKYGCEISELSVPILCPQFLQTHANRYNSVHPGIRMHAVLRMLGRRISLIQRVDLTLDQGSLGSSPSRAA